MDLGEPQDKQNNRLSLSTVLPPDLPTSLDDRRGLPSLGAETEIYDAWQGGKSAVDLLWTSIGQHLTVASAGESKLLTAPVPALPFHFRLPLDGPTYDDEATRRTLEDSEHRLVGMLAAQAAHRGDDSGAEDEDIIASDGKLSADAKRETLQKALNMAASNGDVDRIQRLVHGKARTFVDVNAPDEEGTAPLIYASCFGHEDVVQALIDAGANVDVQDRNQWSPLMWAMTNRHKAIAKMLLDHGASPEVKSSSGRTAFDFVAPNSEISDYLQESGYKIGSAGVTGDFYDSGFSQERLEEEMAENEMKRRMMMESAMNLEVDLSSLGLDEQPESPGDLEEDGQAFVWDRCLNDQMFVFQESELGRILDIVITHMTPQRSPSQKPVPANILFLSARYAHYHASPELLATLLTAALDKINDVAERHQWDMALLAFWISNATLLLHYLKKDSGLVQATTEFQLQLAELIDEIFILIIRDAERRMDKVLDAAMLDHETIAGFEHVHFQHEWRLFRPKARPKVPEPADSRYRPPSPKRRAQTSPRNITSLLSSTLFVLDLYDIQSVIGAQIMGQLLYWLGAELFNRVMSHRKYLARTKAMQIRMNVSTLEDWARSNNRRPAHDESGATSASGSGSATGEDFVAATRRHLAPVIQLLQWLQCFSSLGDDFEPLVATLQQLPRLSPQQLLHAVKHYRPEVGEKGLTKSAMKYLVSLRDAVLERRERPRKRASTLHRRTMTPTSASMPSSPRPISKPSSSSKSPSKPPPTTPMPSSPLRKPPINDGGGSSTPGLEQPPTATATATAVADPNHDPPHHDDHDISHGNHDDHDDDDDQDDGADSEAATDLLLDPALMLPFSLPTSIDMLVSFGAGFGGVNRERARKYIPTVPPEFLAKLDLAGNGGGGGGHAARTSSSVADGDGDGDVDGDGDHRHHHHRRNGSLDDLEDYEL
ncbi:MAG: hypothetical protein M1826_003336 [Phylliscum demangeonii]|nr:MAG: hypothetical protein M1826_003336 [Phylliscum demangeonii]